MAVKLPNPKYKPKKYKAADYPGQKVQIDVKYVPQSCLVGAAVEDAKENGGYYYQYTFIDEYSRFRYLEAFQEHSTYSSAEFIKHIVQIKADIFRNNNRCPLLRTDNFIILQLGIFMNIVTGIIPVF